MQKYASKHTACGRAQAQLAQPLAEQPVLPEIHKQHCKEAKAISPASVPQAPIKGNASSSSLVSGISKKYGHTASVSKQRKRRQETPAALADPLGAFARQASQRQRTLQSGLSLLKGKASQARVVAPNMIPPNVDFTAQLDKYQFQPAHISAQPAGQQINMRKRLGGHDPQQVVHEQRCSQQLEASRKSQQSKAIDCSTKRQPPLSEIQSPGPSQHSISHHSMQEREQVAKKVNDNYFKDIKSSLHKLLQANHAIPRLDTMSKTGRSALASMLTNKLDGVDVVSDLQHHFAAKSGPDQHHHQAEPKPSAASSVDCTPSPDSVAQHSARACQLPKLPLPRYRAHLSDMPSVRMSRASHASGASLGSGHTHPLIGSGHAGFRPAAAAAHSSMDLFDFLAHDAHESKHSLQQGQGLSCSYAKSFDTDEATFGASPKFEWYASLLNSN